MIKQPERRPPLYLVTGLVMGLVLGLIIAWLLWPPRVVDVGPDSLEVTYQGQYRLQVALAYASSQDLGRAQARIALLRDGDPVRALVSQAQLALANSATQREARALAGLADALEAFLVSQQATAAAVDTPNSGDGSQVSTPFEAVAEGATYFLDSQELICESAETPPMVKIFVFDANHNPQAGVLLAMNSEEGEAEFSTGLHPEMSPGYAEYVMTPRVQYSLSILGVQMIGGLQAAACETDAGEPAWGSWLLLFNAEE